jgi:predicted RNA-binding Zn ribbon-like protein
VTTMAPNASSLPFLIDFVNTRDVEAGEDMLDDDGTLRSWLDDHGLQGIPVPAASEHAMLKTLREGLRAVLLAHTGKDPDADHLDALSQLLHRLPLALQVDAKGDFQWQPGSALHPLLARVMGALAELALDPEFARVKACMNPTCQWAFYDRSRNRSHRWCTMNVCGNRVKARRYRARRRNRATS